MSVAVFRELHSGLDREAPGSRAETLRALALAEGREGGIEAFHSESRKLPLKSLDKTSDFKESSTFAPPRRVLDIGCGPGASSLVLLDALPQARVTAVDLHAPYLDAAQARVGAAGHGGRFAAVRADMACLPFPPASVDLLWCEGAVYSIGLSAALAAWRPLIAPGGRLAFGDAVWLTDRPHPRAAAFWGSDYPAMTDVAGVRARIEAAGWRALGDFVLPDAAWQGYYGPLEARRAALVGRYGADEPALAETREEIDLWRAHGRDYGYAFFVAAPE